MTIKRRQLDFGSFLYEKRNIAWNYIYVDVDLGFIYLCNKGNNIFKHVHEYYFEHHISVKIVIKYMSDHIHYIPVTSAWKGLWKDPVSRCIY
jgi:hypothetical protein